MPLHSGRTLVARDAVDFARWFDGASPGEVGMAPASGGVVVAWASPDPRFSRTRVHGPLRAPPLGFDPPGRWKVVLAGPDGVRVLEVASRVRAGCVQPWGDGVLLFDYDVSATGGDDYENVETFDGAGRSTGRFPGGQHPAVVRSTPGGTLWTGSADESRGLLEYGLVARDASGGVWFRDWRRTPAGGFIDCEAMNAAGDDDVWVLPCGSQTIWPLVHVRRHGFDVWPLGDASAPEGLGLVHGLAVSAGRVLVVATDDDRGVLLDRYPLRCREYVLGAAGAIREVARHRIVDPAGRDFLGDDAPGCIGGEGSSLWFRDGLRALELRDW